MPKKTAWLLAPIDRMDKAGLLRLISELDGDYSPWPRDGLKTCDAMRAYLTLARRMYWDRADYRRRVEMLEAKRPGQVQVRTGCTAPAPSLCQIKAKDVNRFLQTLEKEQSNE